MRRTPPAAEASNTLILLTMTKVILGNHSSVIVPRKDRDSICKFYSDVLDASDFSRTARAMWMELKSDNVEEMRKKILDFGVRKLELPDPHLYFQAPGGQCWRLVGTDEDLSFYEGRGEGPNVAKVKEGAAKGWLS